MPTGALSVCNNNVNGKRKRKLVEKEAKPIVKETPMHVALLSKVPTQEELAAKEKRDKIALLKKRLELLKARQLVLEAAHAALLASEPRTGKRMKKAVSRDLSSPVKTPRVPSVRAAKTPKAAPVETPAPKKAAKVAKQQSPALQQQIADLTSTVANLSKQLAQKPAKVVKTAVERPPKVPKSSMPLTNKEKQMLKADIFKLPSDKLDPVIQMCSQNSGVEDKSEDSITIDIDKLDIGTLRELQKYVKKSLSQLSRKKEPAPKKSAKASLMSPVVSPPKQAPTPKATTHRSDSESDSDSSSSSSDSDSDSEPEEPRPPSHVAPQAASVPQPVLPSITSFDALAWNTIGLDSQGPVVSHGDGLWSSFRTKEQEQRDNENERRQLEARHAADQVREVEALRRKAEQSKAKQEEQQLRMAREREEERDREREAARLARQSAQRVDLGGHNVYDLMDALG